MYVIDRIEENIAVITQDDESFEIDVKALPEDAKEGDVINIAFENEMITDITVDRDTTNSRAENMRTRLNNLFGN